MKLQGFVLVLSIVSLSDIFAQTMTNAEAQANLYVLGGAGNTARVFDNRYEGVKGQPTLFEKNLRATIFTTDGKKIVNEGCNLDVFNQDVIATKNKQEIILSKSFVKSIRFYTGIDSLCFIRITNQKDKQFYYQELVTGNFSLLKLYTKTFVKADYQGAYSPGRTQDEFRDEEKLFLQLPTDELVELKSKKALQSAAPDHKEWLNNFMNENKLSIKEEQDLIQIVQQLNQQ